MQLKNDSVLTNDTAITLPSSLAGVNQHTARHMAPANYSDVALLRKAFIFAGCPVLWRQISPQDTWHEKRLQHLCWSLLLIRHGAMVLRGGHLPKISCRHFLLTFPSIRIIVNK